MPILQDFSLSKYEDGILVVSMSPPTNITGWSIRFFVQKRFGGNDDLIVKSCASGYNGTSGVTITDSLNGIFNVSIDSVDTSGMDYGNYAAKCERMSSGARTALTEGFFMVNP